MLSHSSSLKERVAILINSDSPITDNGQNLSDRVADYYFTKRGITPHKITMALGTNMFLPSVTPANMMAQVLTPIDTYCAAHDIKALLCSAGVPEKVATLPNASGDSQIMAFSAVVAAARLMVARQVATGDGYPISRVAHPPDGPPLNCPVNFTTASPLYGDPISSMFLEDYIGNALNFTIRQPVWENWRTTPVGMTDLTSLMLIGGRIGVPGWANPTTETFSETKRIIDDSVETEGTIGPIHIAISEDGEEYGRRLLVAAGYDVRHSLHTAGSLLVPPAIYSYDSLIAGTLNPKQPVLGILGHSLSDSFINSVIFQTGAWVFSWWSSGLTEGGKAIQAGACCACGTYNEPYSTGLTPTVVFIRNLLKGVSMSEAVFAFGATILGWNMTVWGDPLHRPFANRKPPGGFSISDKDLQ